MRLYCHSETCKGKITEHTIVDLPEVKEYLAHRGIASDYRTVRCDVCGKEHTADFARD